MPTYTPRYGATLVLGSANQACLSDPPRCSYALPQNDSQYFSQHVGEAGHQRREQHKRDKQPAKGREIRDVDLALDAARRLSFGADKLASSRRACRTALARVLLASIVRLRLRMCINCGVLLLLPPSSGL
ncbi:hypothetical protein L1887_53513 [Cichorium endivia]|nr:hypothetical protein L1887_53513 [Cichorium endivia]